MAYAGSFKITMTEVKKHNKPNDAWIVLNGGVYNVTSFHRVHPGGGQVFGCAGTDATSTFLSQHQFDRLDREPLKSRYLGPLIAEAPPQKRQSGEFTPTSILANKQSDLIHLHRSNGSTPPESPPVRKTVTISEDGSGKNSPVNVTVDQNMQDPEHHDENLNSLNSAQEDQVELPSLIHQPPPVMEGSGRSSAGGNVSGHGSVNSIQPFDNSLDGSVSMTELERQRDKGSPLSNKHKRAMKLEHDRRHKTRAGTENEVEGTGRNELPSESFRRENTNPPPPSALPAPKPAQQQQQQQQRLPKKHLNSSPSPGTSTTTAEPTDDGEPRTASKPQVQPQQQSTRNTSPSKKAKELQRKSPPPQQQRGASTSPPPSQQQQQKTQPSVVSPVQQFALAQSERNERKDPDELSQSGSCPGTPGGNASITGGSNLGSVQESSHWGSTASISKEQRLEKMLDNIPAKTRDELLMIDDAEDRRPATGLAEELEQCANENVNGKKLFCELLDNPMMAAVVVDSHSQKITWVNPFASFLFNRVESDLVGEDVSILMGEVPDRDNKPFHTRKLKNYMALWKQRGAQPESKIVTGRMQQLLCSRSNGISNETFACSVVIRPVKMTFLNGGAPSEPPLAFVGYFCDASVENMLKTAVHEYKYVTAHSSTAVICANTTGVISMMNPEAGALFGYDPDFMTSSEANLSCLMPKAISSVHDKYLKSFREKLLTPGFDIGTSPIVGKERDLIARRSDGVEFPVQLRVAYYPDPTGHFEADRIVGYFRDCRALIRASEFKLEVAKRLYPESMAKTIANIDDTVGGGQGSKLLQEHKNIAVIAINKKASSAAGEIEDVKERAVAEAESLRVFFKAASELAEPFLVDIVKASKTNGGLVAVCGINEFDDPKTRMDRAVCFALSVLRWAQESGDLSNSQLGRNASMARRQSTAQGALGGGGEGSVESQFQVGIGYGKLGTGIYTLTKDRAMWDINGQSAYDATALCNAAHGACIHFTMGGFKALGNPRLKAFFELREHVNGFPELFGAPVAEKSSDSPNHHHSSSSPTSTAAKVFTYESNLSELASTVDVVEKIKNASISRVFLRRENARELQEQQERRRLTAS